MDLKTYQEQTGRTAIYKPELAPHYLFPGLLVEALELQEKVKSGFISGILDETGDVLWFTAQIHNLAGVEMVTEILPQDSIHLTLATSRIVALASMAADRWLKIVRDQSAQYTSEDMKRLIIPVKAITSWCHVVAAIKGTTLRELLDANVTKLKDRQQRGVLGGSGDDR